MYVPVEISFREVDRSEELEALIREKSDKLNKICDHITSCRVIVEQREKHQRSGRPYHVRLDITVSPGHRLAVDQEPKKVDRMDSPKTEIRRAFAAAERQIKQLKARQQGEIKIHPQHRTEAKVERIFPEMEYGFLKTPDDRQIYFHFNAVSPSRDAERMQPGTGVHYVEEKGEKGPQASMVRIVEKPGPGISHSTL